jgi:small-conductance mechanosensitive channel/CRP-like cAMP-binding protein
MVVGWRPVNSTPRWLLLVPESLRADFRSGEVLAVTLAALLVLLLWLVVPRDRRRLLRQPVAAFVIHIVAYGLRRTVFTGDSNVAQVLVVIAVLSILVCIGRSFVTLLLDVGIGRRSARPTPKIIRDLVLGIVYILIALSSLRAAGIEPGSILTTSALLTAVVGFSLQETLGNLFAGLALQMQAPFEVGDWIQYSEDAKGVGKVLEINWRSTKLLTLDEVEIIVPNGTLGKSTIANYTKPSPRLRRSVFVSVDLAVPPRKVQRLIADAIKGSFGVLDDPPPSVVTRDFDDAGTQLWVRFWTDEFQKWGQVEGEVRDRIWYALSRAGVELAFKHYDILHHEINDATRDRERATRHEKNRAALRAVDFLAALPPQDVERLASAAEAHTYAAGEIVVRKGEDADHMFIVQSGEVRVIIPGPHGERMEVARLGVGKFFGEMALMTGEPRSADVVAARDSELIVVGHEAFQDVLAAHPEFAETVSRIIAERQAKLDEQAAKSTATTGEDIEERTSLLLGKIKKFFSL